MSPPPGFKWPTEVDYAQHMVKAVEAVVPEVDQLSAPVATQVRSLKAAIEKKTGLTFSEVTTLANDINALAHASTPQEVITAAFDLMSGTLDVVASVAQAAGASTSAVQAIPLVGQLLGAVCAALQWAFQTQAIAAAKRQACERTLATHMDQWAKEVLLPYSSAIPTGKITPTNPSGVDPTDLFRALAYLRQDTGSRDREWSHDPKDWRTDFPSYHKSDCRSTKQAPYPADCAFFPWEGNNYPANATTLYLGLAGRFPRFAPPYTYVAPADFALWPQNDWQATGPNLYGYGYLAWCQATGTEPMSAQTQQQIWQLCLALMQGTRDPTPGGKGVLNPDGGASLMPILQDIVNRERRAGRVTIGLLELIKQRALHWTWQRYGCGTAFFQSGMCPRVLAAGQGPAPVRRSGESAQDAFKREWGTAQPGQPYSWFTLITAADKATTTSIPPAEIAMVKPFVDALDQYDWQIRHDIAEAFSGRKLFNPALLQRFVTAARFESDPRLRRRRVVAGASMAVGGATLAAALAWLFA